MTIKRKLMILLVCLVLGFVFPVYLWGLTLPGPDAYIPGSDDDFLDPPTNSIPLSPIDYSVTYGDFDSYSLPLLAIGYDILYGGGTGPGNPFYVVSTPGAIKDDIVLYTGSDGTGVMTNDPGMDDAYPTPSGTTYTTFNTATAPDPGGGGEFSGDSLLSWDIELTALSAYLEGSPLIFFFNHNEKNKGDNQSLMGKAEVNIVDGSGVILDSYIFDDNSGGEAISQGSVDIPWDLYGLPDYGVVNHNLGANQAAFAINSTDLDTFLSGWSTSTSTAVAMQVRFQLSDLSNGYEQLFIQRGDRVVNVVPEPATMILLGFGIIGLAGIGRRINS